MSSQSLFYTESDTERRNRMRRIVRALRTAFPQPACALMHEDAFQLLIATILSAQCTDERVNMVTPLLFAKWPSATDMAAARVEDIADVIRSTGFYHNKSKNIKACCELLVEQHNGKVPDSMEELIALPGVGRKTANVVLGNAFGIPGLPVDTHVRRVTNRLQFTDSENPLIIEKDLCAVIPRKEWTDSSHLFILHGRATCIARRPRCAECVIEQWCPSSTLKQSSSV